jgi:hypothetical protein
VFYIKDDPLIRPQDLSPQRDPKGGARTPSGGIRLDPATPYPPYEIPPPENFFHMQFRDILYAASLIIVGLLFVFQRQSDVRELSNNVGTITKNVEQLSVSVATLQKIQDVHTSDIRMNGERNMEQDRRINEAQQQLVTLVPDMREIRTKLNFVADLMDQRQKQGK